MRDSYSSYMLAACSALPLNAVCYFCSVDRSVIAPGSFLLSEYSADVQHFT